MGVQFIGDRMTSTTLRGWWCDTVPNVHDTQDRIYEELDCTFD